jgi:hypothetical protein
MIETSKNAQVRVVRRGIKKGRKGHGAAMVFVGWQLSR